MLRHLSHIIAIAAITAVVGWIVSKTANWQLMGEISKNIETDQMVVALTFDDGPSPKETAETLKILNDHDIKATFYLTGTQIELHPNAAKQIATAGHELGNHGYTHGRMILRTPSDLRDELTRADALIRSTGYSGPITFRPPYGQKLIVLPYILKQMGKTNVMWSVDPGGEIGWNAPADKLADFVIRKTEPGDIIILHPMFRKNAEARKALPKLITALQAKGFEFVTVSELLALRQK